MNKSMLEDYTKDLERRHKKAVIAVWVLSVICAVLVCTCIFLFFSGFEIASKENYEYQIEQEANDNGEVIAITDSNVNQTNNALYVLIGVAVVSVCITVGVICYGKPKNHGKKDKDNND